MPGTNIVPDQNTDKFSAVTPVPRRFAATMSNAAGIRLRRQRLRYRAGAAAQGALILLVSPAGFEPTTP